MKEKQKSNFGDIGKVLKIIILIGLICILPLEVTSLYAAETQDTTYFEKEAILLKELGLFKGSDLGFELDRNATRVEAAVILVRLLGAEEDAIQSNYSHPFLDVPQWASSYVGYLYHFKMTKGKDALHYGSQEFISAQAFVTFCLRSLGYDDENGDFLWNDATQKAYDIHLIDSAFQSQIQAETTLSRDLICGLLNNMLNQSNKDGTGSLIETMISNKKISEAEAIKKGLLIRPIILDVSGTVTQIDKANFYVAFDSRNGVDFITRISFGQGDIPYIGSLQLKANDGTVYCMYLKKEDAIELIQPLNISVGDMITVQGELVIIKPDTGDNLVALHPVSVSKGE